MDGKLMVFCDEIPGRHKILGKEYRVRDSRFLASDYMTMEDLNTDKIFVSWDSIIPEDREFIELCKHYAQFTESPKALAFRKGGVDFEEGDNIKTSLQEECYYDRYIKNLEYLSSVKQNGGDCYGEAMDLIVQYPFDANSDFFKALTQAIKSKDAVIVLPCFSQEKLDSPITQYRMKLFQAWKDSNEIMKRSTIREPSEYTSAIIREPYIYSDFGEVLYSKSSDELMKIYSMPIWGIEDPKNKKPEYDDGPDL